MSQRLKWLASEAATRLRSFMRSLTKSKVHRYLHAAGTICTLATMVLVWFVQKFATSDAIIADCLLFVTYLTRWQVLLAKIDSSIVDKLPIPDDEQVTPRVTPVKDLSLPD